jgi:23S rRNA (uracil1939-C5)-methyltransferase
MKTETVEIFDYTSDGDGVGRLGNGCIVFVENAVRGDACEVEITKTHKSSCYGKIKKIINPSQHRIQAIEVDCPYYKQCGGCDYRHISYEEELFAKRKRVNDALARIAGIAGTGKEVEDILTTGKTNGYRNNIQLKTNGNKIGFYKKQSHDIVEIEHCLLVNEDMNKSIKNRHSLNDLHIRSSIEVLGDLTFRVSPKSFFQVNTEATLLLYEKAREYADLQSHETLLDLYCGIGTITLFLARYVNKAIGVEINADSISNAKENAAMNNIHNVEFLCEDVSKLDINELLDFKADCIVVDPPRAGLDKATLSKIEEASPKRIVYISCNPATLARDIKRLSRYEVKRVCAVDMFPRTKHVECVIVLSCT